MCCTFVFKKSISLLRNIRQYSAVANGSIILCKTYKSVPISFNYVETKCYAHSFHTRQIKPKDLLSSKERLIKGMKLKHSDDQAPFYELSMSSLMNIYRVTQKDNKNGFCENRLYFIAEHIKCQPSDLSKVIVKRLFIYRLSFDWLENSLKVLLEMGVSGDRILRDLWSLKYQHETIRHRLQMVKDSGCDQVYPWMVRCSDDILNRTIKLSQETKDILGNISTQQYLANRLDTSVSDIENMCLKIPSIRSIRVTKAKSFLDFLFSEGFSKQDIINKPRVLASSQTTISRRLVKLRGLGVACPNLNIMCRGRKGFQKYCNSIASYRNFDQ